MKSVKEIELTLKNEPGRLSEITDLLGTGRIRLVAFYVSTREDEGRLNFVADNPDKAINLLSTAGHILQTHDVIACEIPNHPGGFSAVLRPLKEAGINVDYVYPCLSAGNNTVLIVRAHPVEDAIRCLEGDWIRVLGEETYAL